MNKNVVCAVDFSHPCENAVRCAVEEAQYSGGQVIVVHAFHSLLKDYAEGELPHSYFEKAEAYHYNKAEESLKKLMARYFPNGGARAVLREGNEADVIIAVAEEEDARLIVVGTNGNKNFRDRLLGSVATKVLHRSPLPVLSVRLCGMPEDNA